MSGKIITNADLNNPNIIDIKSPQEKRREGLKLLVAPIVLESVAKDIGQLDNVAETLGQDVAWGRVGTIIEKGVLAGLLYNDVKLADAENKITELENMLAVANKKLEALND